MSLICLLILINFHNSDLFRAVSYTHLDVYKRQGLVMQKKTEGICFAIGAGICWGSMGVAAQVLMENSGFAVGDLVAGRLLGAGALLLMFEHFFMRRSLLKYFSQLSVAKDLSLIHI